MLYLKYRPKELSSIKGNAEIIESLDSMLSNIETCPHVFLLHGQSGCGKTSIGRIIAERLGCVGSDFKEVNSADFRGIDTIREIIKNSNYKPIEGSCRVWLIDECFSKGTLIKTPNGDTPIQDLKIDDSVYSLAGFDTIKNIFINKIPLERVMKIRFTNGAILYCSKDHLFLTKKGWKKACLLNKNSLVLPFDSQSMFHINYLKKGKNYVNEKKTILFKVWKGIKKTTEKILLPKMLKFRKSFFICKNGIETLYNLWKTHYLLFGQKSEQELLWDSLYGEIYIPNQHRTDFFRRNEESSINIQTTLFSNGSRENTNKEEFLTDEGKQSFPKSIDNRKGKKYKENKRITSYLEGASWWKWIFNRTSNFISHGFRMGNGNSHSNRAFQQKQIRISNELQSRYRESLDENSNRGGWQRAFHENEYTERFEKNNEINFLRLESSEIYQQGNNERSFTSIITDTERNEGFINFYDLEVDKHPSYFAEGVVVHNCHKWTNDAQNAMLKLLEDTPKHVYFILCTTEPQKLITTIKSRCQEFQVLPLTDIQMKGLLRSIVKGEEESLEVEVYEQIINDSQGFPRKAIQILEQVLSVPEESRLTIAKQTAAVQSQAIDLCRALLKKSSGWKEVSGILAGLQEQDPEDIRRMVMGYCKNTLLKADNERAGLVLEHFVDPFYNGGFPQLVLCCYLIMKN